MRPESLEALGPSIELEGYVGEKTVALPDGKLILLTSRDESWQAVRLDPADGGTAIVQVPLENGVQLVGYSPALERVIMLGYWGDAEPSVLLMDPVSMTLADQPAFEGEGISWPHAISLFDDGRKLAFYFANGYDLERVGEPPQVWVGDLNTNVVSGPIPVRDVVHGHSELASEMIRDPESPYGTVEPGIVFDPGRGMLYVVHGDARAVTVVDLHSERSDVHYFGEQSSFWTSLTSWFIPPAQAKGGEPSAHLIAWLDNNGSRLFVTGETADAWRDEENRLHTSHSGLGLLVIDTDSLEVVRSLDLPVSYAVATHRGIALTGSTGSAVWCDEVCKPGNNEPEGTSESENLGLIVLDPMSLDIRFDIKPGDWVHLVGALGEWLVLETSTESDWAINLFNMRTGEWGGRREAPESTFFLVTDRGILEVDVLE